MTECWTASVVVSLESMLTAKFPSLFWKSVNAFPLPPKERRISVNESERSLYLPSSQKTERIRTRRRMIFMFFQIQIMDFQVFLQCPPNLNIQPCLSSILQNIEQKPMKIEKQNVIKFFKRLTTSLNETITDTKLDFQNTPAEPSQIKNRLLSWKSRYSELVSKSLKENIFITEQEPKEFVFKDFMNKLVGDFGADPEFMDQMRSLNMSIERFKEFIRQSLIKDPTLFEIK